eukprot:CAMPEP_0113280784 /NCGR_PEP_ID=MMETSP0008_2-20120614/27938_1 /TAXON_ID=97485 /ORGANISM="Prymnesium parvum" /LENGTH=55 /DNA_ID=CAMNT_0000131129 /DNA_START=99 /DNA_END=262 /DNA_ORIENTATION=- /assembly_acc=CAM_ASM_000153
MSSRPRLPISFTARSVFKKCMARGAIESTMYMWHGNGVSGQSTVFPSKPVHSRKL